jgi:hypothetical protein
MAAEPWVRNFGVIDGGLELMRLAWPSLKHVFSVRRNNVNLPSPAGVTAPPKIIQGVHRYPPNLLNQHPVDLLVVDQGSLYQPPVKYERTPWEVLLDTTHTKRQPRIVIETWTSSAQMWNKGPMSKAHTTIWTDLGYCTRCKVVRATDVGGAIRQDRLIVARVQKKWNHLWKWDAKEASSELICPMSNLLTPPGLVPCRSYDRHSDRNPPDARTDPMPEQCRAWIHTEKGVQRLSLEETSRGLGILKDTEVPLSPSLLKNTTSLFHFEYISSSLVVSTKALVCKGNPQQEPDLDVLDNPALCPGFKWNPPDLSEGRVWYNARVRSLRAAFPLSLTRPRPSKRVLHSWQSTETITLQQAQPHSGCNSYGGSFPLNIGLPYEKAAQ